MKLQIFSILQQAFQEWQNDKAPRLSAALAFYTILSITPLFVIVTAIAGFVFGNDAANGKLYAQLKEIFGNSGADLIKIAVENADRPKAGIFASLIGIITLLFGASGVFGELQDALNTVWKVKTKNNGGIWLTIKNRLASFGMVVVIGFLLLVSLIVSASISAFNTYAAGFLPLTGFLPQLLNLLFSFIIVTILFAMIFKILPDAIIAWRDVWMGALVTAVLFTIGKYFIGLYLGSAGIGSAFGAAGSIVAFVVWIYYSGLILIFGAELTKVIITRLGRQIDSRK